MPEIWDVYDENRVKKPYTHVRGVPLDKGDWHLVVETWVVTQDNRVLLTLREGSTPERPPQPRQRAAAPPAPPPLLPTSLQRPVGRLIPKSNVSFTAARTCVFIPLRL